ncbi:thiamine phosphate synthase [Helicobacter sp. 23-1045]
MIEKFLITNGNYNAILANPARLKAHNITKIYLRDKNLSSEILREFQQIKNVEIFVNYSDSPQILAYKYIHLKGDELHLVKALKSQNLKMDGCFASLTNPVDCHDSATQNLAMTENSALDSANETKFAESKILSYSAHSLEDIIRAHKARIDFIFISPIFAVENKNAPLGIEFLAQIPREIKPKIFALGGINASNIHKFENLGIRGVAGIRIFENIFK